LKEESYEENITAVITYFVCINQWLHLLQPVAQLPGQKAGRPIGKMDVEQKLSSRSNAVASKVHNALQSRSGSCPSSASATCCCS
jgi:hypothetical protein